MTAEEVIKKFNLEPLPEEGGFFNETYRSKEAVDIFIEKQNKARKRNYSTAIYYLITPQIFSTLHRICHDEIFHFYAGDPVEIVYFDQDGDYKIITMGNNLEQDHTPQVVVPANNWQGLKIKPGGTNGWSLLGTTVAPGFEFEDFETGTKSELEKQYPANIEIIRNYTI